MDEKLRWRNKRVTIRDCCDNSENDRRGMNILEEGHQSHRRDQRENAMQKTLERLSVRWSAMHGNS